MAQIAAIGNGRCGPIAVRSHELAPPSRAGKHLRPTGVWPAARAGAGAPAHRFPPPCVKKKKPDGMWIGPAWTRNRSARLPTFQCPPARPNCPAVGAGCWMERAASAPTEARQIGFVLLAALTLLALLEHWFRVLPLPDPKPWHRMMPAQKTKLAKATPMLDSLKENSHGL